MTDLEELAFYEPGKEIRLVIDTASPISAGSLGCFLQLLNRTFYAVGHTDLQTLSLRDLYDCVAFESDERRRIMVERVFEKAWDDLPRISEHYPPFVDGYLGDQLPILKISMNSPIEIIVAGIPVTLAAAAIFSGGTVKLPGFQCRLPPLGVGIKSLREALGLIKPRRELKGNDVRRALRKS